MTSNYVIVSIVLSLDFEKCVMSSFEVIENGGSEGPPGGSKQKARVNTVNTRSETLIKKMTYLFID